MHKSKTKIYLYHLILEFESKIKDNYHEKIQ